MFYLAAALLFAIGLAHSFLGERYILIRLFRKNSLPKLFGSTEFTKNTLRFAWHLTTISWFGLAVILLHLGNNQISLNFIGTVIGFTFILHSGVALVASKGKHFSWPVFLIIGVAAIYGSNT